MERAVEEQLVLYEARDGIALLTLNRPERLNAWSFGLQSAYFDALERAVDDNDVRVIVVTGAGRAFCPGGDMQVIETSAGREDVAWLTSPDSRSKTLPLTVPKPTIGAINGACAGAGLVYALMLDLRFAAAEARFSTAFARLGLVAETGSALLLGRLLGTARAMDLLLSGRRVSAEEAYELGLVNRVVPGDSLVAETLAYAADIAANCSPASMAAIKRQVLAYVTPGLEEAVRESDRLTAIAAQGPDVVEGVAAFLEKRSPVFAPLGGRAVLD